MNDFLKKLLAGTPTDIYDYSKSPEENQVAGAALSSVDEAQDAPMNNTIANIESPRLTKQSLNFNDADVIQADAIPQAAKIKPDLPFAYKGQPLPKELTTEPTAPTAEPKKSSLEELLANVKKAGPNQDLKNAQSDRDDLLGRLLWLDAGNTFGQAMVGKQGDPNLLNNVRNVANNKVANVKEVLAEERAAKGEERADRNQVISESKAIFELGDKEKENDPNSDVSKVFREYMRSYAQMANVPVKIDDRMSMADLQKTTGMLGNIVSAKMAADARQYNLALARENKAQAAADKKDMKNVDFMERKHKEMKESKNYMAAQASDSLVELIDSALKSPSAVKEIAATYETIKTLDPQSAVREGEVGLLQQGLSYRAKLESLYSKATNNPRVYGNEFLKKLKEYADFKKQVSAKLYDKEFNSLKEIGKRRGLSDEDIDIMNPRGSAYGAEQVKVDNKFPMTIRKDGKTASVSNEAELKDATSKGWTP